MSDKIMGYDWAVSPNPFYLHRAVNYRLRN